MPLLSLGNTLNLYIDGEWAQKLIEASSALSLSQKITIRQSIHLNEWVVDRVANKKLQ